MVQGFFQLTLRQAQCKQTMGSKKKGEEGSEKLISLVEYKWRCQFRGRTRRRLLIQR